MVIVKAPHYTIVKNKQANDMTDLKEMIDFVGLKECRKEIEYQLASITNHDNRMKRVVLLCMLGEAVLGEIAKENPDKFIAELKAYLTKIVNDNTENSKRLMAHIKENGEIVKNIDVVSDELRQISTSINALMADYDNRLSEIVRARDDEPVSKL